MANSLSDVLVQEILCSLMLQQEDWLRAEALIASLKVSDQRIVIMAALSWLSKQHLHGHAQVDLHDWWKSDGPIVSAAAGFLVALMAEDKSRRQCIVTWLTSLSGAGAGEAIGIRRAAVAALSSHQEDLELVLEKSVGQFGDPLYIKHTPVLQQEGMFYHHTAIHFMLTAPSPDTDSSSGRWLYLST